MLMPPYLPATWWPSLPQILDLAAPVLLSDSGELRHTIPTHFMTSALQLCALLQHNPQDALMEGGMVAKRCDRATATTYGDTWPLTAVLVSMLTAHNLSLSPCGSPAALLEPLVAQGGGRLLDAREGVWPILLEVRRGGCINQQLVTLLPQSIGGLDVGLPRHVCFIMPCCSPHFSTGTLQHSAQHPLSAFAS
jgi:hypothetical protein